MHHTINRPLFTRLGILLVMACSVSTAYAASIDPPAGALVLETEASGVQMYECEYDKDKQLHWVFKAPSATLYDTAGKAVIKHSAGPTWQAHDGSRIVGQVMAQAPSDEPASVPQLLLHATSVGGDGVLANIVYVQRLKTRGGVQPTTACAKAHQMGSSPYIANYRFFQ